MYVWMRTCVHKDEGYGQGRLAVTVHRLGAVVEIWTHLFLSHEARSGFVHCRPSSALRRVHPLNLQGTDVEERHYGQLNIYLGPAGWEASFHEGRAEQTALGCGSSGPLDDHGSPSR